MNNKWNQSGNRFDVGSVAQMKDALDLGIYSLEADPRSGALYLERIQDDFKFGYKTYGIQQGFIDRVERTYANTNGNLGILLNGVKGTGKSVTAKMLCNQMNLPVILINKGFEGVSDFINSIQQDVLILIDEFEKVFKKEEENGSLLTVMDGVLDNGNRRIFLLTTNTLRINENLLQRPGRIRYLKTFSDLDRETIEMIVDDILIYPELRENTVNFISKLEIITVDIVKAVVTEVNIHNEDPKVFEDVFNVQRKVDKYKAFLIDKESGNKIFLKELSEDSMEDLKDKNTFEYVEFFIRGSYYRVAEEVSKEDLIYTISGNIYDSTEKKYIDKSETIQLEKVVSYHSSFMF